MRLTPLSRLFVSIIVLIGLRSTNASAQYANAGAPTAETHTIVGAAGGVSVGGTFDDYLRYLQTVGKVPLVPWGLRTFSPRMVDSLTTVAGAHPWAASWLFVRPDSTRWVRILPAEIATHYNSSYPFGMNKGPVWSGRGLTTSISAGIAGAWGPLSIVVKPIAFRAENQSFPLQPTGATGNGAFRDPLFPTLIDRPQRFGNGAYSRLYPGETTIRADGYGLSFGATTANEWWGPASVSPYIVGNNAAGIPRVFVGTERPVNIYIGKLQFRIEYGIESQSAYSPVTGPNTFTNIDSTGQRRLMSGLALTFTPGAIPGLEVGAGRYFHRPWTGRITGSDLKSPLEGLLTAPPQSPGASSSSSEIANQLASIWMRWALPHSGFEIYGEYGHEDHNIDKNDLYAELDHSRTALLGIRKVFVHDSTTVSGLRVEVFDGTASTNARHRGSGSIYLHTPLRQGHTQDGKVIGSAAGVGSPAEAMVAWDRYTRTGQFTIYGLRMSENGEFPPIANSPQLLRTTGVLGVTLVRFVGTFDVHAGTALMHATRVMNTSRGWNGSVQLGISVH